MLASVTNKPQITMTQSSKIHILLIKCLLQTFPLDRQPSSWPFKHVSPFSLESLETLPRALGFGVFDGHSASMQKTSEEQIWWITQGLFVNWAWKWHNHGQNSVSTSLPGRLGYVVQLCAQEQKEMGYREDPVCSTSLVLHCDLNSLSGARCSHFETHERAQTNQGSRKYLWPAAWQMLIWQCQAKSPKLCNFLFFSLSEFAE